MGAGPSWGNEPDALTEFLGHNADWFDQVGIVRQHHCLGEAILESIPDQVARQVHVAALFLDFGNLYHAGTR